MATSQFSVAGLSGRFAALGLGSFRPAMHTQPGCASVSPMAFAWRFAAASRPFATTPAVSAPKPASRGASGGKSSRAKRLAADRDPKIKMLDKALYKLKFVPPPLRMGRNRYLRHWTIHRAWLLFRRQNREQRERELMQQYQSIQNACEELRKTAGPGSRDLGYLYRVAMEKKGVFRHGGIPIEYARPQTETPGREPWAHDWTR